MVAALSGYYALGTAVSNAGVFTEATTYTRPATNLVGSASGYTETISLITGPTGPAGGSLFYGAIFDSLTGGNCVCYWQWSLVTAIPANFAAITVNFALNTYLVAALSLSAVGGQASSGSTVDAGAQIGTMNGQPVIAAMKLVVQGGSLVPATLTSATGQTLIPSNVNLQLQGTGLLVQTAAVAVTAGTTRTQAGATALTTQYTRVDTSTAVTAATNLGDGVALMAAAAGLDATVWNNTANSIKVYGTAGDTINGMTSTIGVLLHPNSVARFEAITTGGWVGFSNSPVTAGYTALTNTTNAVLTGPNITPGTNMVVVNMTGTLGSGQTLTLPTVALTVAAMHMPTVGKVYVLRVINSGAGAFAWTVTTSTGWTLTAGGTMTVAQGAWKDFLVVFQSLSAATLQNIGMMPASFVL